jgi:outer membrane protein TolC
MAAKRQIVVAGANLQPKVNLGGGIYGVGSSNLNAIAFLSLNINWLIKGFGTTDWTNIQQARWQARQALIRANRELLNVLQEVRTSLLQSLSTEKKIDETSEEVASATEELRLARLRFEHGLGTNLDVLTGQRDLTAAYIDKATAIANYNIAQAQLLHDLGLTSVDSITSGRLLH